jgi:hypothetical protein
MRSSILGFYPPGGVFHPSATNICQFGRFGWLTFGKLTDRTEGAPVPEPAEGAYLLSALKSQRGEIGIARGKAERNPG